MKILGKDYEDKNILKYANTMDSINFARRISLLDGKAKGTEAIEVVCSSGLELLILVDRGLDIASARYKGVNIGFMSKNGITGRVDTNPHENEFLHYFTGGLLTTCGLRNVGPSCRDKDEYHPVHGRINTIAAQDISIVWENKEKVVISGVIRESALFGCNLKLHRKITVNTSESSIFIEDELENESATEEEFMILYHFNFGFPFLKEGCKLEFEADDEVIPRTEEALKGINDYTEIIAPVDDYNEQVFFHLQKGDKSKNAMVKITNPDIPIFVKLQYSVETLPVLAQWKSMKSGDYALGIEPSNNYIMGRVEERNNKTLKKIAPYSKERFAIELNVL